MDGILLTLIVLLLLATLGILYLNLKVKPEDENKKNPQKPQDPKKPVFCRIIFFL